MTALKLNYQVMGEGEPLLLVHGFAISFNIWKQLAPSLCQRFQLVMIQLPGAGESPMPPEEADYLTTAIEGIDGVRRDLKLQTWDVLGYSTGSRIAEAYVQKYAGNVRRAIFLCPLLIDMHKLRALRMGLRWDRANPGFGNWVLSGWRLSFLISWLGFNLKPDARQKQWYAEIGAAPVRLLKETIRAVAASATTPFSVPVPFDMIWGDRDLVPDTPRQPGPRDHMVHGRHAAPVESAEEVGRVILSL